MRIHVLTAGFTTPNGQAFLMPLILHRHAIAEVGISIRLFDAPSDELTECDALLLDSKYYGPRWATQSEGVIEEIATYRRKVEKLIYVDLLDSAGWDHARALPHVSLYCKSQVLRDRSLYLRPLYGYRYFTDYYHRKMGIEDEVPVVSEPATEAQLHKIAVSWNSGLADYSWLGRYRMSLYARWPLGVLLTLPDSYHPASAPRTQDVSCRMGVHYVRETVSFQRKRLSKILKNYMDTRKVSRRRYLAELRNSKIVVSPFGYGEICYRDFEAFMAGALLLKADMSGVETWPALYSDGETMLAHSWDLSDVVDKIDFALSNERFMTEVAEQGQLTYRRFLSGPDAGRLFAMHFRDIIRMSERVAGANQRPVPGECLA